ncbi:nitroreductase family deazaflavin-dependent oxidoreductase [Microbacterium sp. Marseille-Q6965]|uniref:nitroreductase family deazaflavin-dependent oxidoreductase n=1 Tax=Microbacterium sp. Marseille-Q6965 TaxID=2965072 RepID=UPI0021B7E01A|nr:nitroreductase family deazaflavin-dependent oxidoreductase [Microbacterium sp. Marseille-Q6965]
MPRILTVVRRTLAPLSRTRAFRALGPRLLPGAERLARRLSGGRVQVSGLLVPSLTLHTVGARSGESRATELMYTPDGRGNAIVAGSNFARDRHPAWTHNLIAHPEARITVGRRRYDVVATRIDTDPDEREAAWARLERQWPGYRGYERDSGRQVRLFRLRLLRELDR